MPYGPQILWPDHALQGTANAALHPDLDTAKIEVIIRKGFHPSIDSYSTFFENDRRTATGLDGWLRQRGFRRIFLVGLATDFCVAWSAEDASGSAIRRLSSRMPAAASAFTTAGAHHDGRSPRAAGRARRAASSAAMR